MSTSEYICVTSMSRSYYEFIGKYMIESWSKFWATDLIIYSEDDLSFLNSANIFYKDWNSPCLSLWNNFCKMPVHESEKKFAKKGFASLESWKSLDSKKIIWIDADMIFRKSVSSNVLDKLLPNDKLISLFTHNYCPGRYNGLSSESGFYIINTQHIDFKNFILEYERIYTSNFVPTEISSLGDHKILALTASRFQDQVEDLSKYRTTDKTTTPLNHSWLSEYMNHYKGTVKNQTGFIKKEILARTV